MQSIMWDYIAEEKAVLEAILQDISMAKSLAAVNKGTEAIYFVCHGSSYNAATATAAFISRVSGLRAYAYTPANLLYNGEALLREKRDTTIVVPISQTGTSRGAIQALQWAKQEGFKILSITDVAGSPIDTLSDATIFLGCGEENSNAKTKGYSASLLQLLRLGIELGIRNGTIDRTLYNEITQELRTQVEELDAIRQKAIKWCQTMGLGKGIRNLYVLGYSMNFGTAMEGQLKLMETMCMPTMFNDLEEFSHGMHRAIGPESTVLMLHTPHKLGCLAQDTYRYLQGKAGQVVMLSASGEEAEDSHIFSVNWFPHTESLLLLTLAIQVLSTWIPEYNGKDPNGHANNDYTDFVHTRI
ncbi:MAG: SIS domain-containing protein [Candidatus Pelethousia sp.]|nr:SIS domain-containing protein [Candidatus Pelethousia sp.]